MATYTNQPKSTTSFSNMSKNSSSWGDSEKGSQTFLKIDDNFFLLIDTTNRLIIGNDVNFTNQIKN